MTIVWSRTSMRFCRKRIVMGIILYLLVILVFPQFIHAFTTPSMAQSMANMSDFWIVRLGLNLLGYATIFIPAALLMRYFKSINFQERGGHGFFSRVVKLCIYGNEIESDVEQPSVSTSKQVQTEKWSTSWKLTVLLFCFLGLQGSYLTWGIVQERIMTFEYGKTDKTAGEFFKNSTFLVFMNRISAFAIGLIVVFCRSQPRHTAPLYKYSFSSFSNIMSSWCQYEALKFISFPTQVLAKASKIIPVMLMGKIVSKKTYDCHEYLTAAMISMGVTMFLLTSGDTTRHKDSVTTFSGVILLVGYMAFDSFTSNWQSALFTNYHMSSVQMMAGVNMFSCLFTIVALVEQGGFVESLAFMTAHPNFIFHVMVLSICSATGQLFIFYTISAFGAVTFTIIMTLRQALAIFLSCLIYGHPVSLPGVVGVGVVFLAMFLRIYINHRKKALAASRKPNNQQL